MVDYSDVTELPGAPFPDHALSMLYTRYAFAAGHCKDVDVLEIGCGGGSGLGYLARGARSVTGIDVDERVLAYPLEHYSTRENVSVRQADAANLPFEDGRFGAVIIFEAIYYFPDFEAVLRECLRVLGPGGRLILCTVNPEWSGFNPSPHSVRYFSATELTSVLRQHGFSPSLFVAYDDGTSSLKGRILSLMKRVAVRLHLIPRSMKGKVFLKRLFFGKLKPYPAELASDVVVDETPVSIDSVGDLKSWIVIYGVATLRPGS